MQRRRMLNRYGLGLGAHAHSATLPAAPTYNVDNAGRLYIDIHVVSTAPNADGVQVLWGVCGSGQSFTADDAWPRSQAIRLSTLSPNTGYCVYARMHNACGY